jgi:hypothetical protein
MKSFSFVLFHHGKVFISSLICWWAGRVAQVVENLTSKCETLRSSPSMAKNKNNFAGYGLVVTFFQGLEIHHSMSSLPLEFLLKNLLLV